MTTESTPPRRREVTFAKWGRLGVITGRVALLLSIVALFGAWSIQFTNRPVFSLDQQHLFLEALTLAAIGTGLLVNGIVERLGQ